MRRTKTLPYSSIGLKARSRLRARCDHDFLQACATTDAQDVVDDVDEVVDVDERAGQQPAVEPDRSGPGGGRGVPAIGELGDARAFAARAVADDDGREVDRRVLGAPDV